MRKIILTIMLAVSLNTPCFAGDLEDYKKRAEELQNILQEHQQMIQRINLQLVRIDGVISYLKQKDIEKKTAVDKALEETGSKDKS